MQTLHLNRLNQMLHPEKQSRTATERVFDNLGHSNVGRNKNVSPQNAGLDTFSVTEHISELLSPACGMTDEEREAYLSKIMAKLKSGKKLSSEDMRFLQAENPQLYQQAARVQSMRDSLETSLKQCRSKEEVSNVYSTTMSMVSDEDPMKEFITAAYDDALKNYKNSDEYAALPDKRED